jgi:hypothetical protein
MINPHIIRKTVDPVGAPPEAGIHWINTSTGEEYFSVGTATVADWVSRVAPGVSTFNVRSGAVVPEAGDYTADQITNTPAGAISAVTVQDALDELDAEKVANTDDRLYSLKILDVKKNPGSGEFLTIASAIASITSPSVSNRYVINVGVGTFLEAPLTVPQYVSIRGTTIQSTIISPSNASQHLFTLSRGVELSFMTLQGVVGSLLSGKAAVYCEDVGDFAQLHKLSIYDFDIGVENYSNTGSSTIFVEYVDVNGDYSYAFKNNSPNSFDNQLQLENSYAFASLSAIKTAVLSEGSTADLNINLAGFYGSSGSFGVVLKNGGTADISSTFFQEIGNTAVLSENTGAGVDLVIDGVSFRNCTKDLDIENATTTGYLSGYTNITKTTINTSSTFFISNNDRNILTVAKNGGDFTSVKDAMDSITGNTAVNRFLVSVGPGIFIEDQITGKDFVTIRGNNTIIAASNPAIPLIIAVDAFMLDRITFAGVTGAGVPVIQFFSVGTSIGSAFQVVNCSFADVDTFIHLRGSTYPVIALFRGVIAGGINAFNTAFKVEDVGAGFTQLAVDGFVYQRISAPFPTNLFTCTGAGSSITATNILVRNATSSGTVFSIQDGALLRCLSSSISGFDKALYVPNVGSAPTINFNFVQIENSATYDVLVENPGTTGSISGNFDRLKTSINGAPVSLFYNDPVNGGVNIIGALNIGESESDITDVTDLIQLSSPIGVLEGGITTSTVTPLQVSVTAGKGYLPDSIGLRLKKVIWSTTLLSFADNTNNYIYVNNAGTIVSATSIPDIGTTILLSRVRTAGGIVVTVSSIPYDAVNSSTYLDEFIRTALGPIFVSGSIVTENAVTSRGLDITAGQYWYSKIKLLPSGGILVPFTRSYKTAGLLTETTGNTVLDNTQYDNGTNLTNITAGYFVKHALYLTGQGVQEKYSIVTSQAEYSTLLLAQLADLPSPPPFFGDIVASIASIIVQQGTSTIIQIIDTRPRVGFQSPSTTAAASHGGLLGLTNDDHPQYLRTDGTRLLTGNLDLNSNNITNAALVNGVDIEAHASRHLPNGVDPLTTAIALSIAVTNSTGVANSLARSDHTHRGLSSYSINGGTSRFGDVNLVQGTSIVLADNGSGTVTISAAVATNQFIVTIGAGLSVDYTAGNVLINGTYTAIPAGNLLVSANQTNSFIFVNTLGVVVSSPTLPTGSVPLAIFTSGVSSVISVTDRRTFLSNNDTLGTPSVNLTAVTTNSSGISFARAREDHSHAITTGSAANQIPDQASAAGTSASLARADHIHNIPAAAPITALTVSSVNSKGSATTFALSDHSHEVQYLPLYTVTNATQTTTSVTYANVTQLTTGTLAIGTYELISNCVAQSAANNTGMGFRLAEATATVTTCYIKWLLPLTATSNYVYDQTSVTTNLVSTTTAAANTDYIARGSGIFTVTAAGTVAIQIRTENAGVAVTLQPGSFLKLIRIS